jgi:hypothetical protein
MSAYWSVVSNLVGRFRGAVPFSVKSTHELADHANDSRGVATILRNMRFSRRCNWRIGM